MQLGKSYSELTKIGLQPTEIRLYLAMLDLNAANVSKIARHSGIHRPTVYKLLPSLEEKGLVTKQKRKGREVFCAEHPSRLKLLAEKSLEDIESIVPELEIEYRPKAARPSVRYLEGAKGIATVFDDILTSLKHGDIYYRYTSVKPIIYDSERFLPKNYTKRRNKKQLERFVINTDATDRRQAPDMNRAVKIFPEKYGLFDFNVSQTIYGDKIAFIDYNSETAIIIENQRIAEFQQKIFKMAYDNLPNKQP